MFAELERQDPRGSLQQQMMVQAGGHHIPIAPIAAIAIPAITSWLSGRGKKESKTTYSERDPTLPPQIVDIMSQGGWSREQRDSMNQRLYGQMMGSMGRGFGGGGGRRPGGFMGVSEDVGLKELNFEDPYIQAGLRRSSRGIMSGTSDAIRRMEERGAVSGASSGQMDYAQMMADLTGQQRKAESEKDFEGDLMGRKEGREVDIAQIKAMLRQAKISGSASVRAANASARPGMAMARLAGQMAPFEAMRSMNQPYAVNFPQKQYLPTSQTQSGGTSGWGRALSGGLTGAASYFGGDWGGGGGGGSGGGGSTGGGASFGGVPVGGAWGKAGRPLGVFGGGK